MIKNDTLFSKGQGESLGFVTSFVNKQIKCSKSIVSVSEKAILEENELTGWRVFSIRLYDKKGNEIFGYHGFSIIGKCGSIDYRKSPIIEKQYVPSGPICKLYKGVTIEKWDGSDFFSPEDKDCAIYITQKTANILKKNKITNMRILDVCDMEMDLDNLKYKA